MPSPSRNHGLSIAIGLGLLVLYGTGIFGHDLWTPDEPRVAAVAKQVAEGAWAVPTLNGEPFLEQPPLYYWCVALIYLVFGYEPPEIGRLASALFGLGGLWITFLFGFHLARSYLDRAAAIRVGALSALALGVAGEYFNIAHRVVVDNALVFGTTLSAYAALRGLTAGRRGPRFLWLITAYLAASAAFMAKGVIGLAAPALAFLAIVVARREPRLLLRGHLWLAPLCFAAVAGPWLYFLYRATGDRGFEDIFVANTIGRILPSAAGERAHTLPVYHYVIYIPLHMLPTTLFFVGALIRRFRDRATISEAERLTHDLGLCWFATGFVMLSLAATKRPLYMVPFFPAAAVMSGPWLASYLESKTRGWYEQAIGYVLAATVFLAAPALAIGAAIFGGGLVGPIAAGLVLLAVGWTVWRANRRGARERVLAGALFGIVAATVSGAAFVVPAIDRQKSLGPPARRIAAAVPANRRIHVFRPDETTCGMIPYYTGRPLVPIQSVEALKERIQTLGEVWLLAFAKREHDDGSPRWDGYLAAALSTIRHDLALDIKGAGRASRRFRVFRFRADTQGDR